jgi:hypothetical protein
LIPFQKKRVRSAVITYPRLQQASLFSLLSIYLCSCVNTHPRLERERKRERERETRILLMVLSRTVEIFAVTNPAHDFGDTDFCAKPAKFSSLICQAVGRHPIVMRNASGDRPRGGAGGAKTMSGTARSGSGSFRPFREKFIGRLSPRVGGALCKKRITLM